ncbi:MAG: phage terminase large subunit [Betaproteobacteria bacterium]|nr:phage terminase large subunit [Betaproteobacteria bacterium]
MASADGRVIIKLPPRHAGQRRVWNGLRRFNVLRMGRRFGKTVFGLDYLIAGEGGAFHGKPVAWFAPNYKLLGDAWRACKMALSEAASGKNESTHRIEIVTGGVIEFWSLDVDDPARGRKYSRVFIDEAAMVRGLVDKWQQSIRPTLTDYQGGACFASTPKGKNDFFRLDQLSATYDQWASFHAPTADNPYISPAEIAAARQELPDLVFRQEYLADYVDFAGGLVKPEHIKIGAPQGRAVTVMGVDLAISMKDEAAFTAMVTLSQDAEGRLFVRHVFRARLSFNQILEAIKSAAAAWNPSLIAVEEVQFQAAVVQELLRTTKLPVRGIRPKGDKLMRFLPAATRYERGMVFHAPDLPPSFADEILAFPHSEFADQADALSIAFAALPMPGISVATALPMESASW